MKTPSVPPWFKDLKPWSVLNTKDVRAIFGYASSVGVTHAVSHGAFPKPDKSVHRRVFWLVSTVKKEIERRLTLMEKNNK